MCCVDAQNQKVVQLLTNAREYGNKAQMYLEEAGHILKEHYAARLISYCTSRLRDNESLAEEVVQEVFTKIITGKTTYEEKGNSSFLTWLYTIVRNQCKDTAKKARSARRRDEKYADRERYNLPFEDSLAVKDLLRLINRLPSQHREILLLRKEEFMWEEIAEICGISHEAARKRGERARGRLKEAIKQNG